MRAEQTDEQLVRAHRAGDEQAFAELFRRYQGGVYRSAYLIVGNSSDSENVLQDTFVKAWQNLPGLKNPALFKPWLWRIMVRTAWACCRGRQEVAVADVWDETVPARGDLLDDVLREERQSALMAAVRRLDDKHRLVVILYYYDEMSVREIAQAVGVLPGTVKSRLWAARRQLRKELEQGGNGR